MLAPRGKTSVRSSTSADVKPRRRSSLARSGVAFGGITLFLALGAFNSQNNLLFWAFGFALALIIVSGVVSAAMLLGLQVERVGVTPARVGEPILIRYRVRNKGRWVPRFALGIEEVGLVGAPTRLGLTTRLRKLVLSANREEPDRRTVIAEARAFVAHVGANQTVVAEARTEGFRRGVTTLSVFEVRTSFPFGLIWKSMTFTQSGTVIVLPKVIDPAQHGLGAGSSLLTAMTSSSRLGRGDEFFSLREYVPGDPLRDIAWRASARRGGLLVRQHAATTPVQLWIVPVLRRVPGSKAQDEDAISLAAGIAEMAEREGMTYGVSEPLTETTTAQRRGHGHLERLMVELALLELGADDGRGMRSAFPPVAMQRGSVCIVVHGGAIDTSFGPGDAGAAVHVSAHGGALATGAVQSRADARTRRAGVSA